MDIDIDGPEGPDYDRAYWWGPLEEVAELIKDEPDYADFDIDDFMLMCRYTQAGVRMIEYKHIHTRRSIALSDSGGWSFGYHCKPLDWSRKGPLTAEERGFYAPDRSIYDALDRLDLGLAEEMRFGRFSKPMIDEEA
jgi:hypothetical protein